MLTVIIKNDGEDNVTQLTYENLWKELKDIPGSELIVSEDWFDYLPKIKNKYICLVEADCLISPRYFIRQLKEFRTNPGRKIAMLTSKTSVKRWDVCFYGYKVEFSFDQHILPNTEKKSSSAYPVQVGYLPGAIMRTSMLQDALASIGNVKNLDNDLVYLSTLLSLTFWRQGAGNSDKNIQNGNPVYINPNVNYVTTEDYINDIGKFDIEVNDLLEKFAKEFI